MDTPHEQQQTLLNSRNMLNSQVTILSPILATLASPLSPPQPPAPAVATLTPPPVRESHATILWRVW